MKRIISLVTALLICAWRATWCHADCTCDDWVKRDGYCVDYVKTRIPSFPIPMNVTEITNLGNKKVSEVAAGDVAIFDLGRYWHVAYVEKVHLDQYGKVATIDVSEMNFGGDLSYGEYRQKWRPKSESEWKRALCCGITDTYDQKTERRQVPLATVTQIWSPVSPEDHDATIAHKVREVLNRFFHFMEREL